MLKRLCLIISILLVLIAVASACLFIFLPYRWKAVVLHLPYRWNAVIVHHSASSQDTTLTEVNAWHIQRGFNGIGYHYFMEIRDGHAYLKNGRPTSMFGAHADKYNGTALGICVAGNYETEHMSEQVYKDVLEAVEHICRKHHISPDRVWGHRDVAATVCPGKYFPLDRLKRDLHRRLGR